MTKPFKLTAPRALEHQEQAALFQWAAIEARRDPRLLLLNASQNGLRASSIQQAVLAKKCGMKKGFPDVFLSVAANGWHGLFIEMKRKGGVPSDISDEQRGWIIALLEQRYWAVVCFGWEQAVAQIEMYLGRDSSMAEQRVCTPSVPGSSPGLGSDQSRVLETTEGAPLQRNDAAPGPIFRQQKTRIARVSAPVAAG